MTQNILKWGTTLAISCAVLTGCSKETDSGSPLPEAQTKAAFAEQFPNAINVQWDKQRGYNVATFELPAAVRAATKRNSAWYPEGSTKYTYTKLEITWEQLQREAPAVAQAWDASDYKKQGYRLDEIDVKSYADAETIYKLEIELQEIERELSYKADGTLLSDHQDINDQDEDDEDAPSPQGILGFIAQHLPTAVIIDTDTEREGGKLYYEVEVRIERVEKELIFDDKQEFLYMLTEVDERNYATALPTAVSDKFKQLAPNTEDWEDVYIREDITQAVTGYILIVEDEATDRETTHVVDAQGNTIQ